MSKVAGCGCGCEEWHINKDSVECVECGFELEFIVYSDEGDNRRMFADEMLDKINLN